MERKVISTEKDEDTAKFFTHLLNTMFGKELFEEDGKDITMINREGDYDQT